MNVREFNQLIEEWDPLPQPRMYHSYQKVKPKLEEPYAENPIVGGCGGAEDATHSTRKTGPV